MVLFINYYSYIYIYIIYIYIYIYIYINSYINLYIQYINSSVYILIVCWSPCGIDARENGIFLFSTGNTKIARKFCPKIQNCHFKLKFGSSINLNMQNSMVVFTFTVLDLEYPFWVNLIQKKLKLSV